MKCVVCRYGNTESGTTTVTVTRDATTVTIKDVPAEICDSCGESYVSGEVMDRLEEIVEDAVRRNVEAEVLRYAA